MLVIMIAMLDWSKAVMQWKAQYRFVLIENGSQYVMTIGLMKMLRWSVDNLDFHMKVSMAYMQDCTYGI